MPGVACWTMRRMTWPRTRTEKPRLIYGARPIPWRVPQSCVRKATNGENYLGGTSATTNTVTALKLNFSGYIPIQEVSESLNRF